MSQSGAAVMEEVSAEFVRVKEEPDWEQSADERIVLLPEHIKVEKEWVKDEPVCKEEPSCSHTGTCGPGLYSQQAELKYELSIVTKDEASNQTISAKQDPQQECEILHESISDQHQSPERHAQKTADRRTTVAGTPQDHEIFECETCGKTFNQIFFLTSHMQLHKYNLEIVATETFSCDTCGLQFATKKLLHEHESTHIAHEYPCGICGETFSFMYQLTNHTRVHASEKPYKCKVCTKQFALLDSLTDHERGHTEEKLYKCKECDKRFRYMSSLNSHRQSHTTRKKVTCDICKKQFHDKYSLGFHMRLHTGERPYSCEICGKTFIRNNNFVRHRRMHNSN